MNNKKYFWGIFFIALGIIALLIKYNVIETNLSWLVDFWPLLFVFWGLSIISKDTVFRPYISVLSSLFTVFLVIAVFQYIFQKDHFSFEFSDNDKSNYSASYSDSIKFASLEFNSGAGTYKVGGLTDELISAETIADDLNYNFNVYEFDSLARVTFSFESVDGINTNYKNKVRMKLNENPLWDLQFNVGASKGVFDLSDYKIRKIDLNSGATDLIVKLGDKQTLTYFDAEIGAVKLNLEIPKTSGCRIKFNQFLVIKDLDGFSKMGEGVYETSGFELAEKKIIMNVEGGVSSFNVKRY